MEDFHIEQTCEVVLTYRQAEEQERIEPVVLRYERELPESMRRARTQEQAQAQPQEQARPAAQPAPPQERRDGRPAPPPMTASERSLWQSAIAPPEQSKKGRWGVRIFVGASLLVILLCVCAGLWYFHRYGWSLPGGGTDGDRPPHGGDYDYYWGDDDYSEGETTIPRYPTGGGARLALTSAQGRSPLPAQDIYAQVNPSVVTVLGDSGKGAYSVGTGIIFSSDGYLITNHHVIAGCSSCQVWIGNEYGVDETYDAKLVASDEEVDLAVLKIEAQDLPAAEFGISDELTVGDPAYAIGNPLGTELRHSFTNGMISYINRDVDVDGVTMTLLQTTAALNSGNSGGPLINQYGQVIGVNTIKMMSDYDTIEGLGFAIPSSLFVRWVNELIDEGGIEPQPVLGVMIDRTPTSLPDGSTGLEISGVTPGGSADGAGIREGDYVIEFNGQRVYSVEQILAIRRELHVGDEVVIRVYRDGAYLDLTMVLQAG